MTSAPARPPRFDPAGGDDTNSPPEAKRSDGSPLRRDWLSRGLGVASALLGVPQVLSPAGFTRLLGVGDGARQRAVTGLVGVRELTAAAGLLGRPHPAWLWGRVAGDAMDVSLMTRALRHHDGQGIRRTALGMTGLAAITAIDVYAALTRTTNREDTAVRLTKTTTVAGSPKEVYAVWRRFDQLPTFMAHLDEVRDDGGTRSHWTASAPFGRTVEWDAELTGDVPGERIAWRSLDGAEVPNSGEVSFTAAPGDRGTEVAVSLSYELPGGALGHAAARYFGEEPSQQLDDDLRRFKQIIEVGEVVRSDGAPGGKLARHEFPQHPAQPLRDDELAEVLA